MEEQEFSRQQSKGLPAIPAENALSRAFRQLEGRDKHHIHHSGNASIATANPSGPWEVGLLLRNGILEQVS